MRPSRVTIINNGEFNPREWLRREVLWGSLMSPYEVQLEGWQDSRALAQHEGNVMRQKVYEDDCTIESQALAFFNQGKNIAGMISSAVLFKLVSIDLVRQPPQELLDKQAESINKVLGRLVLQRAISDEQAYELCARLVNSPNADREDRKGNLITAHQIMTRLAAAEATSWVKRSRQNEAESLPVLQIPDGGHPRSAGARVENLQPVFKQIVDSAQFKALSRH